MGKDLGASKAATGAERILAERLRQYDEEDWSEDHDDNHTDEELAWAAVCYAAPRGIYRCEIDLDPDVEDDSNPGPGVRFYDPWPWDAGDDKREGPKGDRIRQLEKAGALIAAEIDRLLREEQRTAQYPPVRIGPRTRS